uniref:Uncharacterized protein n=1 Tax=Oreochromis niloticus TaxID=8128 RepID=A0A669DU74_ORENI
FFYREKLTGGGDVSEEEEEGWQRSGPLREQRQQEGFTQKGAVLQHCIHSRFEKFIVCKTQIVTQSNEIPTLEVPFTQLKESNNK